eukprot:403372009
MDQYQLEQYYLKGEYHQALAYIDRQFLSIRNLYHQPNDKIAQGKLMHACNRDSECNCVVLGQYLITIAYHQHEENIKQFLESQFYVDSEIRLPYEAFIYWVQLEIERNNYERASNLIKNYISQSTRLDEEKLKKDNDINSSQNQKDVVGTQNMSSQGSYYQNLFGGMRKFNNYSSSSSSSKDLPLTKSQFYELLELLIFNITLPDKGMKQTVQLLQELPMPKHIKEAFGERLIEIRNMVVAEIKLSNEEELMLRKQYQQQKNNNQQSINQSAEDPRIKGQQNQNQSSSILLSTDIENQNPQQINRTNKNNLGNKINNIRNIQSKIRQNIIKGVIIVCFLIIFYAAWKRGIYRQVLLWIRDTRFVRWLAKILFNYEY